MTKKSEISNPHSSTKKRGDGGRHFEASGGAGNILVSTARLTVSESQFQTGVIKMLKSLIILLQLPQTIFLLFC